MEFSTQGVLTPPPHAEWKISMLFFWSVNPFISTFRAFLDFTLIKMDEVGGGGGGGGLGGVGEGVSGRFPLRHIFFISFPSHIRLCLRSKY